MIDDQWLAEQLISQGIATREQVETANKVEGSDLCRALLAHQTVEESTLLRFLGHHFKTNYITAEKLKQAKIPGRVLKLLSMDFCLQHKVIPVRCSKKSSTLSLVAADPSDSEVLEQAREQAQVKKVQAFVALEHTVQAAIQSFYKEDDQAFDKMDQALEKSYSALLNLYEKRLSDFTKEQMGDEEGTEEPQETGAQEPQQPPEPVVQAASEETAAPEDPQEAREAEDPQEAQDPQEVGDSQLEPLRSARTPTLSPAPGRNEALVDALLPQRMEATKVTIASLEELTDLVEVLVTHAESIQGWRAGHSSRLARLMAGLADNADLLTKHRKHLRLAALLHEVGQPTEMHHTLLDPGGAQERPSGHGRANEAFLLLLAETPIPEEVLKILGALSAPAPENEAGDSGHELIHGARLLAAADSYLDLLYNPDAPGGQCQHKKEALERLSAEEGSLDSSAMKELCEYLSGAALIKQLEGERSTLLLVDQQQEGNAELVDRLEQAGLSVMQATNTATAARLLLEHTFALIISEVHLEPVDGFDFLERLRLDERTKEIPFIFLSDEADSEQVDRAFELAIIDYVIKPYNVALLLAKIKQVLKAHSSRSAPQEVVSGSLLQVSSEEVIRILTNHKRSGRLMITSVDLAEGEVFLEQGMVVQAVFDGQRGEAALSNLLGVNEGVFSLHPEARAPEKEITRPTDELLDTLRSED